MRKYVGFLRFTTTDFRRMIMEKREDKILKIISIEWDMFQDVNNIGGRASCQDDYETFEIMRRSQYENWTEEMLDIYLNWASISRKAGRNLVAEKYGRMMQHTDPLYYKEKIEPELPALSERQRELIDEITGVLVAWEDEFGRNYPKLSGAGRPVHEKDDTGGFTSVETYNRGELATYPVELLKAYKEYIDRLQSEGKSISVMDRETMAALYGYESIDDAEASIR